MNRLRNLTHLLLPSLLTVMFECSRTPKVHVIPASYVYTIIERNDSLYYATQSGEIFRMSPDSPAVSPTRLGLKHFRPIRGLGFTKDGTFYAASYETGVHRVFADTLRPLPKMGRTAWAMKIDDFDRIWLAGRQGVYKQQGDTLVKTTDLHEAYDIDFYKGALVAAHRRGVTLYDSATGIADTTFCKGFICWTIDVFDTLLIAGGVEVCTIINGKNAINIRIGPKNNIPWSITRDTTGSIFLGTQKGLFRVSPAEGKAQCIDFAGKCIKSVFVDRSGRLWVGRYF